jgi:phosphate transport system substrate-binding protein
MNNTDRQKNLNNSQNQTCSQCGFDNNPRGATHCLNCNQPLNQETNRSGKLPPIPWSTVPLLLLILLSGGLSFILRKNAISLKNATNNTLLIPSSSQNSSETSALDSYIPGLQLHDFLKEVTGVPEGVFFYGGAMGSAAIRAEKVTNQLAKAQPQFHLTYIDPLNTPPDSGAGIRMVLDGQLSFCESFRPLKQSEYDLARSRGFILKQVPVAIGAIAFYTNPQIKLPGISLGQVERIYRGELTNWQELGGPDLPIVPVSQHPDAKATDNFLFAGLPNSAKKFSPRVKVVRDTTSAIRMVAATPGAIGYGSQPLVVNQRTIRPLGLAKGRANNYVQPMTSTGAVNLQALVDGSYPLIQRIFVIFRDDGELDQLAGRAYANLLLSKEGQLLIDEAGYLPIRYQTEQ